MDRRHAENIEVRLAELERRAVFVRQGVVASASPLTVYIGGADVAVSARALDGASYSVSDRVAVAEWRGDRIVLGVPG